MVIQSSQQPPHRDVPRTEEETILESSLESFPASDPPAWVSGKDVSPSTVSASRSQRAEGHLKREGWFKRTLHRLIGGARALQDPASEKPPCGGPR